MNGYIIVNAQVICDRQQGILDFHQLTS